MELPSQRTLSRRSCATTLLVFAAVAAAAEQPTPTPTATPPPKSLEAFAAGTTLTAVVDVNPDGIITVTPDNLAEFAAQGVLTTGSRSATGRTAAATPKAVDPRVRERWRKRFFKQRDIIEALERERNRLRTEVNELERRRPDVKTIARIDRKKAEIRLLDDEIRGERAVLSKIVRHARFDGAEPGWFR